ncbi:hypothetical protein GQ53DRAFT_671121 [Thozetella sp. PMI_491]|nr:hypothetical protein GQ53DRAFT_671121 [Thozetella sp. PMI_491]
MRAPSVEATLVGAVRSFDQGGVELFPEKLEKIWEILSQGGGSFHAAEEMLVRGLLKNMNGTNPDAERLRRYPLTWSVLGAAFTRIPAFPLAKSLADRKFLGILQQTLKDTSRPDSQPAQAATRKRKRSDPLAFDLGSQRKLSYCMRTSEAVFQALGTLLSRCRSSMGQTATNPMGVEPIKALFFISAFESMEILVPLLNICVLALQNGGTDMCDDQAEWISTFTSLWDLHRQADGDALEVATHLTALGTSLLVKLTNATEVDEAVGGRWARELRRFLTRNLILPSRAAFFNQASIEAIQFAVEVTNSTKATTCTVLFGLVLAAPKAIGGDRTTKRGNDSWVQAVFDILEPAVRELGGSRNRAIREILDMAVEHAAPLKLHSLAEVCSVYGLGGSTADWSLLLCLARLNPDVFLLHSGAEGLLGPAFLTAAKLDSRHQDFDSAVQFLSLLARGYSKARDLAGFIKKWLRFLALPALEPMGGYSSEAWSQSKLVETVAEVLQSSMNPHQLLALLQWLESQADNAQALPRLQILAAISRSLSQEEFVDAVGTKLHDMAALSATPKVDAETQEALDLRWTIGERTISWSTLEQTERIWKELANTMRSKKTAGSSQASLAAFKFSARAWLCQHPGGKFEADAAGSTSQGMNFDELTCIAQSVARVKSVSDEPWSGDDVLRKQQIVGLLDKLATLILRQMALTVEQREKTYIEHAVSVLRVSRRRDDFDYPQLVLLRAACTALLDSSAAKLLPLDLPGLMAQLLDRVTKTIGSICTSLSQQPGGERLGNRELLVLLITIRAADALPPGILAMSRAQASQLSAYGAELIRNGAEIGWQIRTFLAKHFGEETEEALHIDIPHLLANGTGDMLVPLTTATGLPVVDQDAILNYADAVIRHSSEDTRIGQLETLLVRMKQGPSTLGQLVAINQLVQRDKGMPRRFYLPRMLANVTSDAASDEAYCLSRIHGAACEVMKTTETTREFILAAETAHLLLARRAAAMSQWNIELTLGTVSTICSGITDRHPAATCPKSYKWLTSLVAVVIKRHRKRLDGHYHLLISVLESLFKILIRHPYSTTGSIKAAGPAKDIACYPHWVQHAKLFARLLTLVCEPSVASVSRSQSSMLDSEKDRAKRYAGQYMYQVLMCYVQLQLEHVVPHAVREVLEPGLYSVLDITTPESLRIMSDAMDLSGRAVMKELYRQHQKFGKWTGV